MEHHGDDRGRLFEDLVSEPVKCDTDIQSPWDTLRDKAAALTDRLRSVIDPKAPVRTPLHIRTVASSDKLLVRGTAYTTSGTSSHTAVVDAFDVTARCGP